MLYISLSAIILLATSFFIFTSINSRIKNQVIGQVEQQGLQVVQEITQSLRNASWVNQPEPGGQATQLSVNASQGGGSVLLFDLSAGNLRTKEGESDWIQLTYFPVTASNLLFKNMAPPRSFGSVQFQFTLTYANPTGKKEYDYSKTFYATASLRGN